MSRDETEDDGIGDDKTLKPILESELSEEGQEAQLRARLAATTDRELLVLREAVALELNHRRRRMVSGRPTVRTLTDEGDADVRVDLENRRIAVFSLVDGHRFFAAINRWFRRPQVVASGVATPIRSWAGVWPGRIAEGPFGLGVIVSLHESWSILGEANVINCRFIFHRSGQRYERESELHRDLVLVKPGHVPSDDDEGGPSPP